MSSSGSDVAVVTGAGGAIGRAVALACSGAGMRVAAVDASAAAGAETVDLLPADGLAVTCDVTDEDAVAGMTDEIVAAWADIDVLVNCAGVRGGRRQVTDSRPDDWRRTLAVNLTGPYLVSRAVAAVMVAAGGGAIVNVGSTAGRTARLGEADYCAAKAGLEQLTRVMAVECAPHGVRVNAVCPGATETPFLDAAAAAEGTSGEAIRRRIVEGDLAARRVGIPLGRLARPEDHVGAILFLSSDAARHITGQVLYVDGGESAL